MCAVKIINVKELMWVELHGLPGLVEIYDVAD